MKTRTQGTAADRRQRLVERLHQRRDLLGKLGHLLAMKGRVENRALGIDQGRMVEPSGIASWRRKVYFEIARPCAAKAACTAYEM